MRAIFLRRIKAPVFFRVSLDLRASGFYLLKRLTAYRSFYRSFLIFQDPNIPAEHIPEI